MQLAVYIYDEACEISCTTTVCDIFDATNRLRSPRKQFVAVDINIGTYLNKAFKLLVVLAQVTHLV